MMMSRTFAWAPLIVCLGVLLRRFWLSQGMGFPEKVGFTLAFVLIAAGCYVAFGRSLREAVDARWPRNVFLYGVVRLGEFLAYLMVAYSALSADLQSCAFQIAVLAWAIRPFLGRLWVKLASVPFASLIFAFTWLRDYEAVFDRPGMDTYAAIFQTNFGEAIGYVAEYSTKQGIVQAVGFGMLFAVYFPFAARLLPGPGPDRRAMIGIAAALAGIAVAAATVTWQPVKERVTEFAASAEIYRSEAEVQRGLLDGIDTAKVSLDRQPAEYSGNLIFILGESVARFHMGLYGYHRDTTPKLVAQRDRLIVHTDTISPHSQTAIVMKQILTGVGFESAQSFKTVYQRNLIAELRAGGFKTYWYSNQSEFGLYDNVVSLLGKTAHHVDFTRKSFGDNLRGDYYDDALLSRLEGALEESEERKAVFLHMYSAHAPYCDGVPKEYRSQLAASQGLGKAYFGDAQDRSEEVNCYDNSVRYVDSFIAKVIELSERQQKPTTVVFLSDHGEDVAAGTAHNPSKHSALQIEIPQIFYANAPAKGVLKLKWQALAKNAHKPTRSTDFYHTALDLAGARSQNLDPKRSLASDQFEVIPRLTTPGPKHDFVAYDQAVKDRKDGPATARAILVAMKRYQTKQWKRIWAHRVNSIGKLLETKAMFSGVETDVIFDSDIKTFSVSHPPKPTTGFDLRQFLEASKDKPDLRIWLDWKNAKVTNVAAALAHLNELDRTYGLKKRVVVETNSTAVFGELKMLSKDGWFHSYYLPTTEAIECGSETPPPTCSASARRFQEYGALVGADAISFDDRAFPFVNKYRVNFGRFRWLTWAPRFNVMSADFAKVIPDVAAFDAYLFGFNSKFSY